MYIKKEKKRKTKSVFVMMLGEKGYWDEYDK